MDEPIVFTWTGVLNQINLISASAVVILSFSMLAYSLTYNLRSEVARAFCILLACVTIVYAGDVALARVETETSAWRWLRFEWLGIAFVPAAYLHFADAVLRTTGDVSARRRVAVVIAYLIGPPSVLLAWFTDWLVYVGRYDPPIANLYPGPLFWFFLPLATATVMYSAYLVWKARQRCLTAATRQRKNRLLLSYAAPALGVFPYLVVVSLPVTPPSGLVLLLALVSNVFVGSMLFVMAYTVAYYNVLTPDRVVRYRLLRFLMRGPLVAIAVIAALLVLPQVESLLGLPREAIVFSAIVAVIVCMQLFLSLSKGLVDHFIYREDREEIAWLRELDRRLLTTSDLREFLENVLVALCELLRVPAGFVAVVSGDHLLLETTVGPPGTARRVLEEGNWAGILRELLNQSRVHDGGQIPYVDHDGYRVWLLRDQPNGENEAIGLLAVQGTEQFQNLDPMMEANVNALLARASTALADRQVQQEVFEALQRILPEMEEIQRWRGMQTYTGRPALPLQPQQRSSPIYEPDFQRWVRDALSHYWGGPKLSNSPLLRLRVVSEAMEKHEGNPAKALRAVLTDAIEGLRPDGQREMTRPEWLLYNILELKFIQGLRVRDIAQTLAMSESDLYRKQRVAIAEVADVIAEFEARHAVNHQGASSATDSDRTELVLVNEDNQGQKRNSH